MRPVRLFAVAAAVALVAGCAAPVHVPTRLVFVPQNPDDATRWPDMVPAETNSQNFAQVHPGPFVVALELLDDAARSAYLEKALGRRGDPFVRGTDGQARFVTMRVEIRNVSKEDMTFNPQQMILVTDAPDYVEPLDATRLHEGLTQESDQAEMFLRDMHKALYDTSVSLRPGESITRLLVIPYPHAPFHQAKLECAHFTVGEQSFSFDVPLLTAPDPGAPVPPPGQTPPPKHSRRAPGAGAASAA